MKFERILILVIALTIFINCNQEIKDQIIDKFMNGPTKELFKVYHHVYEKKYDLNSEEAIYRYKIFKANLKIIKETNNKNLSYKFGINKFADLSQEEFQQKYLMREDFKRKMMSNKFFENIKNEDYFDTHADSDDKRSIAAWAPIDHRNRLGPARDQGGECGSCWAFATLALMEASNYVKRKVKTYLSVQQLIDCDSDCSGCEGGYIDAAVDYAKRVGIIPDAQYPYTEKTGTCQSSKLNGGLKLKSYSWCTKYSGSECTNEFIYNELVKGPFSTGFDGAAIQFFKNGIFDGPCSSDNHAVVVVGFGVENGTQYWLVRNSWGSSWGENGHIRVKFNDANNLSCFLTTESWRVEVA